MGVTVQTPMDDETLEMLDKLMLEDGYTERAPYVRRVIRQAYARRMTQPQLLPTAGDVSGIINTEEKK
jgi:metal-responsive CopG/Arc/MetJ family transcriptional regulator